MLRRWFWTIFECGSNRIGPHELCQIYKEFDEQDDKLWKWKQGQILLSIENVPEPLFIGKLNYLKLGNSIQIVNGEKLGGNPNWLTHLKWSCNSKREETRWPNWRGNLKEDEWSIGSLPWRTRASNHQNKWRGYGIIVNRSYFRRWGAVWSK